MPRTLYNKIKITTADGRVIYYDNVTDTFRDFVRYADPKNVEKLKIMKSGHNIITEDWPRIAHNESHDYTPLPNGKYLYTTFCTKEKYKVLLEINERLHLGAQIDWITP